MKNYRMYAKYTTCLYNVLEDYPNLLDNLVMSTTERTQKFKEMFIAKWFNFEIGLETIGLFKIYIENRFKTKLDYYEQKLTAYETEINFLDGRKTTYSRSFTTDKTYDDTNKTDRTYSDVNSITREDTKESNESLENTTLPRAYSGSTPTGVPSGTQKQNINDTINSVVNDATDTNETTDTTNKRVGKIIHSENETRTGDENIIKLKVEYMKQIQNIYEQFVDEFKTCFIQLLN